MGLQLIYGTAGTGKTTRCMELLERQKGRKAYYLVPEQYSYAAERLVTERFGAVSPATVEVSSFKRLYYQTLNETGGAELKKLSVGGKTLLLNYLCLRSKRQLKVLGKTAGYRGFASMMADFLRELKAYNVTPELLLETAKKTGRQDKLTLKLEDLSLLYTAYTQTTSSRFSDADDEIGLLARMIRENHSLYRDALFVLDGFSGFTPQEFSVISALMGCAEQVAVAFDCDTLDGGGTLFAMQRKNYRKLCAAAAEAGMPAAQPQYMDKPYKFRQIPELAFLLKGMEQKRFGRFEGTAENIRLLAFNQEFEEIDFVAREIIRLVRGGIRYQDILIVARDSARYFPALRRVMDSYEIPVFLSDKLNAASQPAILAVLSALDVIAENFSYESMFSYLKSGFANLNYGELDLLENYILATGIRGSSWTGGKDWHYTPAFTKSFGEQEAFLERINQIRRRVVGPLAALKKGLSEEKPLRGKCGVLYHFVEEIGLFERIQSMIARFKASQPQTAAYYGQVWNLLMNTLDEMVEVLGGETVSFTEFQELLNTALGAHEIGVIPTTSDVVTVAGEDAGAVSRDVVFLVGMNDGVYPMIMTGEGILSDRERTCLRELGLELAQDTVSKAFEEDFVLYTALSAAKRKLYLSYPVSDFGGGGRLPARFTHSCADSLSLEVEDHILKPQFPPGDRISRPAPTFAGLTEALRIKKSGGTYDTAWDLAAGWLEENTLWKERMKLLETALSYTPRAAAVSSRLMDEIYQEGVLKVSVSRLELYQKCPFAHYARYLLKLQQRQQDALQVTDTGSFLHEILEQLSARLQMRGETWHSVSEEQLQSEVRFLTEMKIAEVERQFDYPSQKRRWMLARLGNTLATSVLFVARHLKAGRFVPLGYEIQFDDHQKYTPLTIDLGGKKMKLRGKIDRADIYEAPDGGRFLRVVDYKSGSNSFDIAQMYYGLQLQLMVYLDRLCDLEDAQPAGILYFRLHDPAVPLSVDATAEEIEQSIAKDFKMNGLVLADDQVLEAMDGKVKSGSDVIPAGYNKSGGLDRFSSAADASQFRMMRARLRHILRQVGKELLRGNADIAPVSYKGNQSCAFCDYREVCHFDRQCGSRVRKLDELPKEEIWKEMEKAGETHA